MQNIVSSEIFIITLVAGVYLASLVVPENEVGVAAPVVGVDSRFAGVDERDRDSVRGVSTGEPDDKLFAGPVGRGFGIRVVGAGGIHEK